MYKNKYMWQSRVEIGHYYVVYFNCIIVFEALYRRTSTKGGAHTHCNRCAKTSIYMQYAWAPPLTEVLHFSRIVLDFYPGVQHVHSSSFSCCLFGIKCVYALKNITIWSIFPLYICGTAFCHKLGHFFHRKASFTKQMASSEGRPH